MFIVPFIILANRGFMSMIMYYYFLFTIPGAIGAIIELIRIIKEKDFNNNKLPVLVMVGVLVVMAAIGSQFDILRMASGIILLFLPVLLWGVIQK